ncbi:MAG: hypothetical protein GOMPHAMPRED_000081 [Gomphillus americanus]|uniref:Ribosome quality control complex subunit 2 n=1 Tax=Gomphillus americanus TaxID=1940652 RepID=A0A8H3HUM4_9LECA|nr:MAG: hypothetical protein GOMPHAMPRED_000081 [Gomphillus americanus]
MKQRFSSLDVKVLAAELRRSLLTLRVSNIYDLSSRIFLLKFAKPSHREQLLVDSGFRCHLTQFARATAATPSAFVARLRKFLKTRRVTEVRQVGTDRVLEIVFSDGLYRLFLEFYAGGNIILTNRELNVLACLRVVSVEEGEEVRVGGNYMLETRQNINGVPDITEPRVRAGLETVINQTKLNEESGKKVKKRKTRASDALRKALAGSLNELPPSLLEHAFKKKGYDASIPIQDVLDHESQMETLLEVLRFAREVVDTAISMEGGKGYIVAKLSNPKDPTSEVQDGEKENMDLMYEDFQPFRPSQFESDENVQILEFDGFNATVDEFFSSIESQKLDSRLHERKEHARRKLENARQDHERRLGGLQQVQELNVLKAQAIEANLQRVQEATIAVNGLIAQGMDWMEIGRLVEMEQVKHNPVAEIIRLPLKLYENTVTLRLYQAEIELEDEGYDTDSEPDDSDGETDIQKTDNIPQALDVDIDLALSPWSNARQYYEQKRTAADKEQKTLQASEKALKSTEKKIAADLKKGLKEEKEVLRQVRKQFWFEKFYYFLSSEGYLVLAGKDVQQSEILYKRYLSKGDAYIHAELDGAASVIIKNKSGSASSPIPPSTLTQAGAFCVATSSAWVSKAIMAAWWVNAEQVSKIAPTGEYLGPGLFVVKGQKNFLLPAQLLLGFGVLFKLDDASLTRHTKHRVQDVATNESVEQGTITSRQPDSINSAGHAESDVDNDSEEEIIDHTVLNAPNDDNSGHDSEAEDENAYSNPLQADFHNSSHRQSTTEEGSPSESVDGAVQETAGTPAIEAAKSEQEDVSNDEQDLELESLVSGSSQQHQTTATSIASSIKGTPQVRGKHGKKAKMKAKYAHQDEEDRALALRLLGSKAGQENKQAEVEKKVNRQLEEQAAKERRKQQHAQTQTEGKASEKERQQRIDQGTESMNPEEIDEMNMLESYVGTPLPGDEVLDALVVCAPWDTLGSRLKWRVKLQPGTQKKGKAVREILDYWKRQIADREKKRLPDVDDERYAEEKTARREGELIKSLRDVEVIGVVPVMKLRNMITGAGSSANDKGKGGKGTGKGGNRGGRGSKKAK